MSGGSFQYAFRKTEEFNEELAERVKKNRDGFSDETMSALREILNLCQTTAKLQQEVEWLYSGDTGEESFARNLAEIKRENPALFAD